MVTHQEHHRGHQLRMAETLSAWIPERLHIEGKIFVPHIFDKGLVCRICKQRVQVNKKKDDAFKKRQRILMRQFNRSRKTNCQ